MRASDIGDTMTSESLATLLAAAPDLLAACRCVMECADMSGAVRAMVKDAIDKAIGEA